MNILDIKNLTFEANGNRILDNMNISFEKGRTYAIVGPNGAGKSTLAYNIMGLSSYRNSTGEILFMGEPVQDLPIDQRARKGMTLGWQEPARFEGLKIRDFLKAAAKDKSEKNLLNALNAVGLRCGDYIDRAVDKTLSGGERKRIELASIYVMEPELVLLDEPDSGIDVAALERIFEIIGIMKSRGTTVILITHSKTVLQQAEYAFLMCHGRIVDQGPVSEISKYFEEKCIPCPHKNIPQMDGE
jgi:Fe-S cluster assembly ATP-binding protein